MKAQISLEYIFIIGIVIIALTPVFYYTIHSSNQKIKMEQVDYALSSLKASADNIYALGVGNSKVTEIYLPPDVKEFGAANYEIFMIVEVDGKESYIEKYTKGSVSGNLDTRQGLNKIFLNVTSAGVVELKNG